MRIKALCIGDRVILGSEEEFMDYIESYRQIHGVVEKDRFGRRIQSWIRDASSQEKQVYPALLVKRQSNMPALSPSGKYSLLA